MDDFDFENIDFGGGGIDWSNVPSIDISGVGINPDELDMSWLDDALASGEFTGGADLSWLDSINFDDLANGIDLSSIIGDQPGDYDLTGSYGDPLAPGVKESVDDLLARNALNDPFSTYDSPKDFPTEGSYGNPLAPGVKESVDDLFKYNTAIAQGGYPVLNKDGTVTVKDSNDKDVLKVGNDGKVTDLTKITDTGTTKTTDTGTKSILDTVKGALGDKKTAALLAALLGGIAGLMGRPSTASGPVGYRSTGAGGGGGGLTATRQALSPTGAPGAGGKRFMTDVRYAADGGLMNLYDANTPVAMMATGGQTVAEKNLEEFLKAGMGADVGDVNRADYMMRRGLSPSSAFQAAEQGDKVYSYARGGLSDLGGYTHAKGGRMLKGPGDGMSDSIPASIEGKRPARLANDEFVVPADVVSHLGNGSSDAGAKRLYEMMADVRKARTGSTKQGKEINPKKYLPR